MTLETGAVRWTKAQGYEREFWLRAAGRLTDEARFEWYRQRAADITAILDRIDKRRPADRSILEIGPGPIGIISFIEANEKYAIDPLEDYYGSVPLFTGLRDRRVQYRAGKGEDISGLRRHFSFVIIDNVIDHSEDPERVLSEIYKNLEPDGILFISLNIYTRTGVFLRRLMETLEIDKGHPFSFSQGSTYGLLQRTGFNVLHSDIEDYHAQRHRYLRSRNRRLRLKARLGLTDFRFSAFCGKMDLWKFRLMREDAR